jgi:hypothetical protein
VWSGGLFAVGSDDDVDLDSLTVQGRAVICRRFAHSPGDTYDFLVETVRQARKSVIGAYSTLHDHPLMLLALEYGAPSGGSWSRSAQIYPGLPISQSLSALLAWASGLVGRTPTHHLTDRRTRRTSRQPD